MMRLLVATILFLLLASPALAVKVLVVVPVVDGQPVLMPVYVTDGVQGVPQIYENDPTSKHPWKVREGSGWTDVGATMIDGKRAKTALIMLDTSQETVDYMVAHPKTYTVIDEVDNPEPKKEAKDLEEVMENHGLKAKDYKKFGIKFDNF